MNHGKGDASERSGDYQIVIIDDHELFSGTLMIALRDRGFEARKVPVAHLEAFAAQPRGERPGVVVLDLNLGCAADGERIKGHHWMSRLNASGWPVLAVTGSDKDGDMAAAIAEGAAGALSKSSPLDELLSALAIAARGESLVSEEERRRFTGRHQVRQERPRQVAALLCKLTPREREVLEAITRGLHAAEIARQSVVSLATVRTQIRHILGKLEVNSQIEAIALLRQAEEL